MSWRVVIIQNRCKLEYKLGYLVCRGEEQKKVFLNEISTLIIESTATSLTTALLSELVHHKINVIFCDERHNPESQLLGLYSRHDCSGMLKKQLSWTDEIKLQVWSEIIKMKIAQQFTFLQELGSNQAHLLYQYFQEVQLGDLTNREGHAAKVYFNELFGLNFKRNDGSVVSSALNYGYSIILSAFNREVVACGYNTQLGLWHKNEYNQFNLSCDLMEPFRVLIDRAVYQRKDKDLNKDYKRFLCNILNESVKICDKTYTVLEAIGIYTRRIFCALEDNDLSLIRGYEL